MTQRQGLRGKISWSFSVCKLLGSRDAMRRSIFGLPSNSGNRQALDANQGWAPMLAKDHPSDRLQNWGVNSLSDSPLWSDLGSASIVQATQRRTEASAVTTAEVC